MRRYRYEKHTKLHNQLAFANTLIVATIVATLGTIGYLIISNVLLVLGSF